MKLRWMARTSLFARMSILFGLLVTVPLVISGIVLSMVGWYSVHQSGHDVAGIGRKALDQTKNSFGEVAQGTLDEATSRLAGEATQRLGQTTEKAKEKGKGVLETSVRQMSDRGKKTVGQATSGMAAIGQKTLQRSLRSLRAVNVESLDQLQAKFVKKTQKELADRSSPVKEKLRNSTIKSWGVSADRRALSVNDYNTRLQFLIVRSLQYPLQTVAIHTGDPPAEVRKIFETYVRKDLQDIVRVVLVSPTGTELARIPETEPEEDWSDATKNPTRANFFSQRQQRPYLVEPVRWDERSGRWIQRLVHQVAPIEQPGMAADGAQPDATEPKMAMTAPTSFIAVDYAVSNVAVSANVGLPEGMEVDVVQTDTGKIISSTDRTKQNQVSNKLLAALPTQEEAFKKYLDNPCQIVYKAGADPGVPMQGLGRYWRPEDHCWTVVLQSEKSVLQTVEDLDAGFTEAAQAAMSNVSKEGEGFINERNRLAEKRVETLTDEARRQMDQKEAALKSNVEGDFKKAQAGVVRSLEASLTQDVEHLGREASQGMDAQAKKLAADAAGRFSRDARARTDNAAQMIEEGANRVANHTAWWMLLNSGWLIPLFLVLALFLAMLTARSLVKPINQLVRGTQALAAGEYNQRIPVRGDDELARLALAFNDMASAIQTGQAELQQSHDSLSTEKARIEGIVHASPDGLVMLEPGGSVAFMNPTAVGLLGVKPEEAPPAPFELASLPAPASQRLQDCLTRASSGEGTQEIELSEPQRCVLQLRTVYLCSQNGRSYGRLLHMHDITRERVIDEMKTDFISLVSHELRTPLTSILGFSSYMLTGKLGTVASSQQTALESIHRQAKRLSAIISDFLDISRIESGKIEMKKEVVQVAQVAERVAEDLRPQAAEKSIAVAARVEPGSLPLAAQGDEQRIAQVFTNLVGNALKFTEPEGRIDILLARQNGELLCRVRDTGCGIPPDELDRVFDRFYQVEKVVTRKSGGTGLGLAIVKNIIEAHGGHVWIESEVGRGTQVSFTLPGVE